MGNLLQLSKISKSFPGVKALNDISFNLNAGEIHCICGENGAGKSTLIKIISGAIQPNEGGEILFEGRPVKLNPHFAMQLGIQTIYQEHTVLPHLSITENIFVGMEITKNKIIIDKEEMRKKTKEVLEFLNSSLDPDQLVDDLSSGEQKIVEIAKALVFSRKVIILDEPTASFSASEIEHLLDIVKKITERGIGIIYISHHLEEVFKIADMVTILRDGNKVNTCRIGEIDEAKLIRDMVGRDASAFYHREHFKPGEVVLETKNLTGNGVWDVSFTARRGEIVGLAGMVGSGRSELITLLFGGAEKLDGEVYVMGKKVNFRSPAQAIRSKMCFITEDRQNTGLFLKHTIARNTIIANMVNIRSCYIHPKEENEVGNRYVRQLGTKAEDASVPVMSLSGGNQQKVVLAKWFYTNGEIYFFDEPTRGIDVGSKQEIYKTMTELLRQGKSIVMASSDMPEVVSMSDRVYVMKNGRINGELFRQEVSEQNILKYSIGGTNI